MTPTGRELDARLWELTGGTVVARDWPCYLDDETGDLITMIRRETHALEHHPVYVGQHGVWPADEHGFVTVELVPFFSSEDVDALLLCERLRAMGWHVVIDFHPAPNAHKVSVKVLDTGMVPHPPRRFKAGFAAAATLHEAVAQAAYAALALEGE